MVINTGSDEMPKLALSMNETLMIEEAVRTYVPQLQPHCLEEEISRFVKRLDVLKVEVDGPLIVKSYGTRIKHDTLVVDYELIAPSKKAQQYQHSFFTTHHQNIRSCIRVAYKGDENYVHLAGQKLDIHLFENDIEDSGILFMVLHEDEPGQMHVDYYKPID